MRKYQIPAWAIASLVSATVLLSACGQQNAPAASSANKATASVPAASGITSAQAGSTITRDYVAIGVDPDAIPMTFHDSAGVITGFDADMAREAFKRAGLKYEFVPMVWVQKEDDLLKTKKLDAIWSNLTITDARRQIFAFSTPYIKNRQAIMVRADSPIKTKADLGGKTVAVQKGGTSAEVVKQLSGASAPSKVDELNNGVEGFTAVLAGKADAAVADSLVIQYYATNSPGKFRILDDSFQEEEFGVAVRPDDKELLEKINKALADMQADGTTQTIHQRWFGPAVK